MLPQLILGVLQFCSILSALQCEVLQSINSEPKQFIDPDHQIKWGSDKNVVITCHLDSCKGSATAYTYCTFSHDTVVVGIHVVSFYTMIQSDGGGLCNYTYGGDTNDIEIKEFCGT